MGYLKPLIWSLGSKVNKLKLHQKKARTEIN